MTGSPERAFPSISIRGRAIAPGRACGPLRRNRTDAGPARGRGVGAARGARRPRRYREDPRLRRNADPFRSAAVSREPVVARIREAVRLALGNHAGAPFRRRRGRRAPVDSTAGTGRAVLDEGDIVLLDGDRGVLTVPGGLDRAARGTIRGVFAALASYGKLPGDETLLRSLLEAAADPAVPRFRARGSVSLPPRGLRGLPRGGSLTLSGQKVPHPGVHGHARSRSSERVLAEAAARCDDTVTALESAEDLEDLHRGLRGLEASLDRDLRLLDDLRGDPDRLEQRLEPVLAAAAARRAEMEDELRSEVKRALALPDDFVRARMGGLFRLLRRARAAHLDPEDVGRLHKRLAAQLAEERARAGTHLVVPLASEAPHERALVGGKAHALIEAHDALPQGCRVPGGFVVTSAAYRLLLFGEIGEKLRLAIDAGDDNAVSRTARAALLSGDVPDEVREAIRAALVALGASRFAVRSSATIEDGPLGSLAGLFDTYLGVTGFEELLDRVRWAWASLWNARAVAALNSMGLSPLRASQAVLVQEMIETRSAGVLFSRDPSGRPDTLLINAAWGLGEGISQGELAGDLFWVRRSTGELTAAETGRASNRIELAPHGIGTVEVPLSAEQSGRPCLTAVEIARVAALARALEEATGRAQDVEFGFDHDGGLVVFQMRRIVPRRSRGEPMRIRRSRLDSGIAAARWVSGGAQAAAARAGVSRRRAGSPRSSAPVGRHARGEAARGRRRSCRSPFPSDGEAHETKTAPPWTFTWNAGDGAAHRLDAVAKFSDGTEARRDGGHQPSRRSTRPKRSLSSTSTRSRATAKGDYVTDLTADGLQGLSRTSDRRPIDRFSAERRPLRIAIVLDTSLSMEGDKLEIGDRRRGRVPQHPRARRRGARRHDSRTTCASLQDLTSNTDGDGSRDPQGRGERRHVALRRDLQGVRAPRRIRRPPRAWSCCRTAATRRRTVSSPGSLHTLEEAQDRALRNEVMVFAIGLGRSLARDAKALARNPTARAEEMDFFGGSRS